MMVRVLKAVRRLDRDPTANLAGRMMRAVGPRLKEHELGVPISPPHLLKNHSPETLGPLRGLGFVDRIGGVHAPIVLVFPYLGLIATFVLGYFAISRAIIIAPPASIAAATAATKLIVLRTRSQRVHRDLLRASTDG